MIIAFALLGCAPDLALVHPWDDGEPVDADTNDTAVDLSGRVQTVAVGDGLFETTLDARDGLRWVPMDFDADGVQVEESDPAWDMKGKRFDLAVNSGVSGPGDAAVLFLPGVALADAAVPADPVWLVDLPDGDDPNQTDDLATRPWFDYNGETHVLTPADLTWLLRTTEGAVVAFRIGSYYTPAGDAGYFTLTWRKL